ncbi:MAG: hypothetical protein SNH45_02510 [Rikenellaceae bacterium]
MIKNIFNLFGLLVVVAMCVTSCADDSYYRQGIITFHKTGLYFDESDTEGSYTQTTTFEVDNVATLAVEEVPDGWDVKLEFYKGVVTVTRPTTVDDDNAVGEITFTGETPDGYSVSPTLDVGVVEFVNIPTSSQANSMIVSEPNKFYTFSPTFKGEEEHNAPLVGVADCELLWRSYPGSIRLVQMLDSGLCGFYLKADEYDLDEDGSTEDVRTGNALIAALNDSDEVVWSWHIWITDDEVGEVQFNNEIFMDRNLGAASGNYTDTLSTYGMYYQWGRKDPFVGPIYFDATSSISAIITDGSSSVVSVEYEEVTSSVGTVAYAIKNPDTFIMTDGATASQQDWLYSDHNTGLWSDDEKTIYDPSPKGWRVPKSTSFEGVTISGYPDPVSSYLYSYAANLIDVDGEEATFMGLGRRNYITGRIMNTNSSYAPWTGYYWTSGCVDGEVRSMALTFSNEELFYRDGNIDAQYPMQRANGFQIRCIKHSW